MKTKLIVFAFAAGFFLSLAEISAGQIQEEFLRVSVPRANIRISPSLKGEVIFQASEGDTLRVIRKEGGWYLIEAESGRKGYVSEIVVMVLEVKEVKKVEPAEPAIFGIVGDGPLKDEPLKSHAFNNEDIVAMVRAGLSDNIIITVIRAAALTKFDLTPSGIIALKNGGASEAVIQVLLRGGNRVVVDSPSDSGNTKAEPKTEELKQILVLPLVKNTSPPGRLGVGLSTFAFPGGVAPSVLYDLNDRLTANGAFGFYGGVTGIMGGLLYRVPLEKSQPSEVSLEPYFGGSLIWIHTGLGSYTGYGGSGGIFVTVKSIPRLRFGGDINFVYFNVHSLSVAGVGIKLGLHYFF